MKKWLSYTLYGAMWIVVVAYLIYASVSVRNHRQRLYVEKLQIRLVDSSALNNLVTTAMVERWIEQSRIKILGQRADSVELLALKNYIQTNGFVKEAKCYTTYDGTLHLELSQLRPALRVLLGGYDSYITAEGYIFQTPSRSSNYSAVVSGNYSPIFAAGYEGSIHDVYQSQIEQIEAEIKRIEVKGMYPLYAQRIKLREQLREVNSRYTNRRLGEARERYQKRIDELRERNATERKQLTSQLRVVEQKLVAEQQKQKVYELKQKKIEKRYQDFINLIIFVNIIEKDKFWSSEIVQLVATESTDNNLLLELIPRSGNHTIIFGELRDVEEKLDKAKTFYRKVLTKQGWNVESINLEYKNQVVCKARN